MTHFAHTYSCPSQRGALIDWWLADHVFPGGHRWIDLCHSIYINGQPYWYYSIMFSWIVIKWKDHACMHILVLRYNVQLNSLKRPCIKFFVPFIMFRTFFEQTRHFWVVHNVNIIILINMIILIISFIDMRVYTHTECMYHMHPYTIDFWFRRFEDSSIKYLRHQSC